MNLYMAGAAIGVTTTAAVAAVWVFGTGGAIDGMGSGSSRTADTYDIQIAPYMARVNYQSGTSALVPISLAFRVTEKQDGAAFCRDLARIQMVVNSFMSSHVHGTFSWPNFAASGLDAKLADKINGALGRRAVKRVFAAAGGKEVGERPVSCTRLTRLL